MLSSLNNLCIHSMLNLISADSSTIALQLLNRVNTWGVGTQKWSIIHMCLGKFNSVPVVAFCSWNRHNNTLLLFCFLGGRGWVYQATQTSPQREIYSRHEAVMDVNIYWDFKKKLPFQKCNNFPFYGSFGLKLTSMRCHRKWLFLSQTESRVMQCCCCCCCTLPVSCLTIFLSFSQ